MLSGAAATKLKLTTARAVTAKLSAYEELDPDLVRRPLVQFTLPVSSRSEQLCTTRKILVRQTSETVECSMAF